MTLDQLLTGLFIVLFVVELYLFAQLFSGVDQERFARLKLLGPFAFLFPGVLSARGRAALMGVLLVAGSMILLGIELFDIQSLP